MKQTIQKLTGMIVAALFAVCAVATVASAAGLLKPLTGSEKGVQMKSHQVDVTINNGFARTEVDQVFINTGSRDLEAVYSFPLPKQASLSELSLWIDGREVLGEVMEKKQAKKTYEKQKSQGNDTALAEKNEFKTFEIKIYPVRAEAETRIRLVYYQPLEIDLNIGRYVYPLEDGGTNEKQSAFWTTDDIVNETLTFNLQLKSAFSVKDIRIPDYDNQAVIKKINTENGSETYTVGLSFPEASTLSKDIVFYYRLKDTAPARLELIPYRADTGEDGTFMAVVTPGASLQKITDGTDWTFVLDVSGSMGGEKIGALVDGVCRVIKNMSPEDRFRVVTFNDKAYEFSGGYIPATRENIDKMQHRVKAIKAGGGTALYAGLKTAYKNLDTTRTTGIVLVTDGVANVGPTQHKVLLSLLKKNDYRLFIFVIGNGADQPLLNALAKNSGGFAMNISSSDDIIGRLIQAKAKVLHECIYDAELKFKGEKVKQLTPPGVRNLYMGQQLVVFGKYSSPGEVEIELTGKISGEQKTWTCKAVFPESDMDNPEIERLWALSAIEDTMETIRVNGKTNSLYKHVVSLGTEYSLVTDYTSMVVVKEMETMGIDRKNAQRVYTERKAQEKRSSRPAQNYRVNNSRGNSGGKTSGKDMFNRSRSHNIGSGPVGPLFVGFAFWLRRRKNRTQ